MNERKMAAARAASPSYDHVGSTLERHDLLMRHVDLGSDPDAFEHAVDALRTWAPQRSIGARVRPADAIVREGETVLVLLGPVVAPVRIVRVIDEPDRFGYAYGTLPGHPERGEELFLVERTADGVVATIVIDAQPAWALARASAPLVRWLQRIAMGRYLRALRV